MKQKKVLRIMAFAILAILGTGLISAYGYNNGFMNPSFSDKDKEVLQQQREAIQQSIEDKDYETWESLMKEKISLFQKTITEETFNSIVQRHAEREQFRTAMEEAKQSGDFGAIQAIKEQYGIGNQGFGMGKGNFRASNGQGLSQGLNEFCPNFS
ncbi:MAG: hypothetical protein WD876_00855 [Candidatus Pacearchaeota archaeon]